MSGRKQHSNILRMLAVESRLLSESKFAPQTLKDKTSALFAGADALASDLAPKYKHDSDIGERVTVGGGAAVQFTIERIR